MDHQTDLVYNKHMVFQYYKTNCMDHKTYYMDHYNNCVDYNNSSFNKYYYIHYIFNLDTGVEVMDNLRINSTNLSVK